jgi:hypothetical protein
MIRIVLCLDSLTQVEVTDLQDTLRLNVNEHLEFYIRKAGASVDQLEAQEQSDGHLSMRVVRVHPDLIPC